MDSAPRTYRRWFVAYNSKSTTVLYGLPPLEQQNILRLHRLRYLRMTGAPWSHSYDLSCQFYKNVRAVHVSRRLRACADDDSDDSFEMGPPSPSMPPLVPNPAAASPTMPPLEPVSPSDDGAELERSTPPRIPTLDPEAPANRGVEDPYTLEEDLARGGGYVPGYELMNPPLVVPGSVDGERVERAWAAMNPMPESRREMGPSSRGLQLGEGFAHGGGFVPASALMEPGAADGEGVERLFAALQAEVDATEEGHALRIISLSGVRDVQCHCTDDAHSVFTCKVSYAFRDNEGNIVVKKNKTKLMALN
ncbi:hypothetical protein C8R46DRAFT_1238298 [Mycena filopes]|nr:hypothetical protein C8R46DRAFT_1238298 [Mycena filopes]